MEFPHALPPGKAVNAFDSSAQAIFINEVLPTQHTTTKRREDAENSSLRKRLHTDTSGYFAINMGSSLIRPMNRHLASSLRIGMPAGTRP